MAIRVVCFDFQDTLARFARSHYALYVDAAGEHGVELTVDSFSGALDDAYAPWTTPDGIDHSQASASEESFTELRTAVHRLRFEAAGVAAGATLDAIIERLIDLEAHEQHYRLHDDAVPALERLAGAGIASIVVSNHIWRLPDVVRALGISSRFEGVLTSARVGYRKPHPRLFAAAVRLGGVEPGEMLFVGDNLAHDVTGPRAFGMRAVLLDRDGASAGKHGNGGRDGAIRSLLEVPLS